MSLVVNTFPHAFLEVLDHSLQHGGRNRCHFVPDVLFQIHCCPLFLFVHLALEISSEEEVLRLGTLVPTNIEVPTKYQPSHNNRIVVFFKDKFLQSIHIFICLVCQWTSWAFYFFNRVHKTLKSGKPLNHLCSCYSLLSKSFFLHFKKLKNCGRATQICVFTLQLCRTGDADLRF